MTGKVGCSQIAEIMHGVSGCFCMNDTHKWKGFSSFGKNSLKVGKSGSLNFFLNIFFKSIFPC